MNNQCNHDDFTPNDSPATMSTHVDLSRLDEDTHSESVGIAIDPQSVDSHPVDPPTGGKSAENTPRTSLRRSGSQSRMSRSRRNSAAANEGIDAGVRGYPLTSTPHTDSDEDGDQTPSRVTTKEFADGTHIEQVDAATIMLLEIN